LRRRALAAWSDERGLRLEFIQPRKPVQNAYIESFNGRLRDEYLANWFTSLSEALGKLGGRITKNNARTVRRTTCCAQSLYGQQRRCGHEER
jgi:transposase InsO family protein